MTKKIYVLDTSVYLTDWRSIYSYGKNDIIIPLIVLEELDRHKKRVDGVGTNARSIIRTLDEMRDRGNFVKGVRIQKGSGLVFTKSPDLDTLPVGYSKDVPDHQIIAVALTMMQEHPNRKVFVVSNDINLRIKCDAIGINAESYAPENVIKELEFLQSEGYEQFLFADDNFTLNAKRVSKLCRRMRKAEMDIEWFCDSRVDHISYDMFREMVKTGCRCLFFGIESGNQRILDYYKKGITPEQTERAVRKARKAGVDVIVGSFIVGAPDETRREIVNTLQFANKLDIDVPDVNILGAHTGTDIWNELVAKGLIDEEKYWETEVCIPRDLSTPVPYEQVRSLVYKYFKAFYLNPKQLLTEILRTSKSPFRIAAILNNLVGFNQLTETLSQAIRRD